MREPNTTDRYKRICEATIQTAERSPKRRGPFVFDEDELQKDATAARIWMIENGFKL